MGDYYDCSNDSNELKVKNRAWILALEKSSSNSPQAANNLFECIINRFVRKYLDCEILRVALFPDGLR